MASAERAWLVLVLSEAHTVELYSSVYYKESLKAEALVVQDVEEIREKDHHTETTTTL
jgi:hypothetical protein